MLSVDFFQPGHASALVLVRFYPISAQGYPSKVCDMALARVAREVVSRWPAEHCRLPRTWDEGCQRSSGGVAFADIPRDPSTWGRWGFEVLEHRPNITLRWRHSHRRSRFNGVTRELLEHPAWTAAVLAWQLGAPSGHTAVSPRARV